jgi:tetratricopeptide (TPR) repeat protein
MIGASGFETEFCDSIATTFIRPGAIDSRRSIVKKVLTRLIILSICATMLLAFSASTAGEVGKIPVTTKSDRALEYYLRGRSFAEKLRVPESRRYFQEAISEDSNFAMAYYMLAFAQPSAKGFFESFNKALSLLDKCSKGEKLVILGTQAGDINGDPTTQRKYFRELVDMYPNDERAHNYLANHYFRQQMFELAIIEYERVNQINPTFSQSYNQLGYAYRFLGRYNDAEKAFQKYIELIPDDPNPYDSYAELLMEMGRFDESIKNYRKALKVSPEFSFSNVGIASDLTYMGRRGAAMAQLQKMYDNALDDGQRRLALTNMAVCLVDSGEIELAIEKIRQQMKLAEKINDTAAIASDLAIIAFLQLESGEPDEALGNYKKALDMVEGSSLSEEVKDQFRLGNHFNMARVELAKGEFDKAKANATAYADRADAAHNPSQIRQAHQLMGMIALEEGDYQTAIQELLQGEQRSTYNMFRLGLAYEGLGDRDKAREYFDKASHFYVVNTFSNALVRTRALEKLQSL